jgi:manganese/iron transport system ATP-binding protein
MKNFFSQFQGLKRRQPHEADAPSIEVQHINLRYNGGYALRDIDFRLEPGNRIAVVGPNGAGKSTLFKIIAGVLPPTSGQVMVYGHGPRGHICIAYVPQRSQVDWSFPVSVADVVLMGRVGMMGYLRQPSGKDREYVQQCLEVVGMQDLADRQIGELSGGQQQRMFIARALAQEAELMLMDEPLTGLDIPSQEDIFKILDELRNRRVTVMVATHDLNMAAERFDQIMLLNTELLAFGDTADVYTIENLKATYGDHLRVVETAGGVAMLGETDCGGQH